MEPSSNESFTYNAQHYPKSVHKLVQVCNCFTYHSPVYKDHLAVCQIWPMPIFSWSKSSDSLCCNLGKHKNSIHAWMPRFDAKYLITEHLSTIVNPSSMIHQKDMFSFFPTQLKYNKCHDKELQIRCPSVACLYSWWTICPSAEANSEWCFWSLWYSLSCREKTLLTIFRFQMELK